MQTYHILLIEDDLSIVENLTAYLTAEGFSVVSASGQDQALSLLETFHPDLVLLDITLSQGNGYSTCTAIKKTSQIPVIFLTALTDEFSVVTGLDMGADDYICKPFRPRELVSRIRTVLRRTGAVSSVTVLGNLSVDTVRGTVTKNSQELFLSALEYRLLLLFLNNRGKTLTRNVLLEEIWDLAGDYVNDNTLTVYIKRLREKIEDNPQEPTIIKTIRGIGYRLEIPSET